MHIKKKADDTNVKDGTAFFAPLSSSQLYTSLGMLKRQRIVSWNLAEAEEPAHKKCDTLLEEIFPVLSHGTSKYLLLRINKILWLRFFLLSKWAIKNPSSWYVYLSFLTMANKNLTLRKLGLSLLALLGGSL